jgi:membrane-associated phospholipid phosphatase
MRAGTSAQLRAPARLRRAALVAKRPHPVGSWRIVALRLAGGAVVLWGLISSIGLLLTHVLVSGPVHSADRGVDVWLAARRTGLWNSVTSVVTGMAQTYTVVAVAVVVVLLLRWRLGQWNESWVLVTVMAGELLVFLAVTLTVHRHRPPVARLDVAPPTSSFPSGHTAAAVALYGCIAFLLLWVYGRRRAALAGAVVLWCIPVIVGLSRLYRGMHYPTDVLAGALTGGLWLLLVITTLLPRQGPGIGSAGRPARGAAARGGRRDKSAARPGR